MKIMIHSVLSAINWIVHRCSVINNELMICTSDQIIRHKHNALCGKLKTYST